MIKKDNSSARPAKSLLLAGSSALTMLAVLSLPAMAQATDDLAEIQVSQAANAPVEPVPQSPAEEVLTEEAAQEGDEEIVVVGSRIRRDTFNSASPIQVITREESTLAGYNSTTEALQGTAVTGGAAQINNAFGGFVTDGGPGANTLSLRGLGAGRTLVLINGRRVAPAGTRGAVGSADLNVLPSAMVERIEILRDGASSIYGSDAIAGVVNVITRTDVEGVIVEGQYNKTHDGGGDEGRASIVGGMSGDRWSVSASAELLEREGLTLADRDWTQCNTDNFRDPVTGESLDDIDPLTGRPKCYPITGTGSNGVTINTIGTTRVTVANGAVPAAGAEGATGFNRWRPNSAVTTGLVGFEGVGGAGISLNVRDTFEKRMLDESLVSGVKIMTAFVQGSYELKTMGDAELYGEALFNRRESEQVGYRQLTLDYRRFSPLIPDNLQFSNFLGPVATSGGERVGVRAFIGFGNDKSDQEVDYYKLTGGVRGDFFIEGWKYDIGVSHSESDASYTFQSFLTDKLTNATNAVVAPAGFTGPVRNGFTCAINLTNPGENCIVAPVLSTQVIAGNLPQDFKDYIFRPVTGRTQYQETVFSANVDGPLFKLFGDLDVVGAFGIEYRTAEIDDQPPVDSVNGNLLNLTSAAPTKGDDSVFEAYGEIEIPILANVDFAKELTINASGRYTNYDSYGSDWTYKVGGIYSPFDFASFRATYGTSYRAPALFEQFQGATSGFLSQQNDPCNDYGDNVSAIVRANCASEGLDPAFFATSGITVFSLGGAGTGLEAETSKNFTAGLILQTEISPEWGEIAFAVDYYDIKIENGVSQVGALALLDLCYNDPQFRAGGGFCNLINARDPSTNALTVRDSYTNIATQTVQGIDYNLRYEVEVYGGTVLFNAEVTQFLEQGFQLFPTDPLEDYNGEIAQPEFAGDFDLSYEYEGYKIRYGLEWISSTDSYARVQEDPATSIFDFDTPDYFLHNVSFQYANEDMGWEATAGVRNLLDEEPPTISSLAYNRVGNAPLYSGYDYVGRRFFVNITKSF